MRTLRTFLATTLIALICVVGTPREASACMCRMMSAPLTLLYGSVSAGFFDAAGTQTSARANSRLLERQRDGAQYSP